MPGSLLAEFFQNLLICGCHLTGSFIIREMELLSVHSACRKGCVCIYVCVVCLYVYVFI